MFWYKNNDTADITFRTDWRLCFASSGLKENQYSKYSILDRKRNVLILESIISTGNLTENPEEMFRGCSIYGILIFPEHISRMEMELSKLWMPDSFFIPDSVHYIEKTYLMV